MKGLQVRTTISADAAKRLREVQSVLVRDGKPSTKGDTIEYCIQVAHDVMGGKKKGK